jgi:endonuclease YncB( thermonuclease family)
MAVILILGCAGLLALWQSGSGIEGAGGATDGAITCSRPAVIDGDTFDCSGRRIRLASIDTPDMPGHCVPGRRCTPGDPDAARGRLIELTRGPVSCDPMDIDGYGRTVALCRAGDEDLSCALVRSGAAVERYGVLHCS